MLAAASSRNYRSEEGIRRAVQWQVWCKNATRLPLEHAQRSMCMCVLPMGAAWHPKSSMRNSFRVCAAAPLCTLPFPLPSSLADLSLSLPSMWRAPFLANLVQHRSSRRWGDGAQAQPPFTKSNQQTGRPGGQLDSAWLGHSDSDWDWIVAI